MAIEDFESSQGELGGLSSLVDSLIGDTNNNSEEEAAKKAAEEAANLAAEEAAKNSSTQTGEEDENASTELSEEDKTNILSELGGSGFDDSGNIVDDKGEVLITSEEIKNALKETNEQNSETLIDKAIKISGFDFKNENGEPLKFENTENGVIELAKQLGTKFAEKEEEKLYNTFPVVKDLVKHLIIGGKAEEFFNASSTDYSNITLTDDTEQDKYLSLIKDKYVKVNNMSEEEAQNIVNFHKDAETWKEEGKKALSALSALEVKTKQEKEVAYQNTIKAQQEANVKFWMDRKAVIDKGVLVNNVTIPVNEREQFFNYISKPVDARGLSQYQIDASTNNLESDLFYTYLRFKKADFKSLIQSETANERVTRLKGILSKRTTSNGQQSKVSNMRKLVAGKADEFPGIEQITSV